MRYRLQYNNSQTQSTGEWSFSCLHLCQQKAERLGKIPGNPKVNIVDTMLNRRMAWTGKRRWYDLEGAGT